MGGVTEYEENLSAAQHAPEAQDGLSGPFPVPERAANHPQSQAQGQKASCRLASAHRSSAVTTIFFSVSPHPAVSKRGGSSMQSSAPVVNKEANWCGFIICTPRRGGTYRRKSVWRSESGLLTPYTGCEGAGCCGSRFAG